MTEKSFNYENMYKLITKEDSMHIHKILGGIVLLNYIYRYGHYIETGHMNIITQNDMYLVLLHGILSISSLVFHISGVRNPQQPMIYPEYRMHSILFACRSVACCMIHYYISNNNYKYIMAVCGSTFVAADLITMYYNQGGKNGKTMRDMPFDKTIMIEDQQEVKQMQSYHQIGATLYMFYNVDTAFSPMFAIQLAALLMTMARKGIINTTMWHRIYSLSLWMNYLLFLGMSPGFFILLNTIVYAHNNIVFRYKVNKYAAWAAHFLFIIFYKEFEYEEYVNEQIMEKYQKQWKCFIQFTVILTYLFLFSKYKVLFLGDNKKTV